MHLKLFAWASVILMIACSNSVTNKCQQLEQDAQEACNRLPTDCNSTEDCILDEHVDCGLCINAQSNPDECIRKDKLIYSSKCPVAIDQCLPVFCTCEKNKCVKFLKPLTPD